MKTQTEIAAWIKQYMAELLDVTASEIDETYEFDRFGLNSSAAVSLIGDLEEWLDYELSPSLFFEFNNISQVSAHLAEELRTNQPATQLVGQA